jgi:hypothetical protein
LAGGSEVAVPDPLEPDPDDPDDPDDPEPSGELVDTGNPTQPTFDSVSMLLAISPFSESV